VEYIAGGRWLNILYSNNGRSIDTNNSNKSNDRGMIKIPKHIKNMIFLLSKQEIISVI